MNKLNGLRCYLAGPMDFAPDRGIHWRQELSKFLTNLDVTVIDPTKKIHPGGKTELEMHTEIAEAKERGDFETVAKIAKLIRNHDLRFVDISDFLIVLLDQNIKMCGTYFEIANAVRQRKPVLVVNPNSLEEMSLWMFGEIPFDDFFHNFEELKFYLEDLNTGKQTFDDRWVLLNDVGVKTEGESQEQDAFRYDDLD